jgi:F-type H+-transporting ATPase subunit epsilon
MAAEKHFTFELATPQKMVVAGETDDAVIPAANGEMEVLPGHQPALTMLRPGRLVATINGVKRTFYVSGGYAEILPNRIVVLADNCEDVTEIDRADARTRLQRAETELEAHRLDSADARKPYQQAVDEAEARARLSAATPDH